MMGQISLIHHTFSISITYQLFSIALLIEMCIFSSGTCYEKPLSKKYITLKQFFRIRNDYGKFNLTCLRQMTGRGGRYTGLNIKKVYTSLGTSSPNAYTKSYCLLMHVCISMEMSLRPNKINGLF